MFSQDDIDAVLNDAQDAVSELAGNVSTLVGQGQPAAAPIPAPRNIPFAPTQPPPARPSADRLKAILKLRVPVVVRLAERTMLLNEIMKIVPGKIIEFPRTVDEELDLLVNNHQIGSGVAVKVSERFGIRVTYVGDIKDRLKSLTAS